MAKGSNRKHLMILSIKKEQEKLKEACESRGFKFAFDNRLGNPRP